MTKPSPQAALPSPSSITTTTHPSTPLSPMCAPKRPSLAFTLLVVAVVLHTIAGILTCSTYLMTTLGSNRTCVDKLKHRSSFAFLVTAVVFPNRSLLADSWRNPDDPSIPESLARYRNRLISEIINASSFTDSNPIGAVFAKKKKIPIQTVAFVLTAVCWSYVC